MSPTRLSLLPDHHPKGSEEFDVPLDIEVTRASKSAIEAIEKAGGTVTCVHHNRLGLRALLAPEKFEGRLPKMAKPPPKLMPFYLDFERRGYLSPEIQLRQQKKKLGLAK